MLRQKNIIDLEVSSIGYFLRNQIHEEEQVQ